MNSSLARFVFSLVCVSAGLAALMPMPRCLAQQTIQRLPPVDILPNLNRSKNAAGVTLSDLENLAVRSNPAVARAVLAVDAARGNWLQAGLYPNPLVGGGEQQVGSRGRAEQDNISYSQEIVRGGKLKLSREVAAREVTRAEQNLAVTRVRVLTDVRIAFYTALVAQQQRTVADRLVEIARSGLETAEGANRDRPVYENDVLEARIELRSAEIEARQAYNRHLSAWRSLAAVIGQPARPLAELSGDLTTIATQREWDETIQRVWAQSPQIAAASTQIERARAALRRARAEPTPNLTIDALYNWRDNGIGGDPDGAIQLSLPLPVFNRNQGNIGASVAEIGMAQCDLQLLELGLQNRLAGIYERYATAHYQVIQYRDAILPAARAALKLTDENFRAGKVEYDDLLTGQRTNARANIEYLNALRELRVAEATMEGFLLTSSLGEQ